MLKVDCVSNKKKKVGCGSLDFGVVCVLCLVEIVTVGLGSGVVFFFVIQGQVSPPAC